MGKLRLGPAFDFEKPSLYQDVPIITSNKTSLESLETIKEVEKIVYVEKPIEIIKEVEKIVEKEVIIEKQIEIPVEIIKEVEVIKVIDREVEVPVPIYKEKFKEIYKVSKWAQLTMVIQSLLIVGLIISHFI